MSKVKMGFARLTVPEQVEKARSIVTALTGNADFPTPVPALAAVSAAATALETAYNESRNRDKNKVAIMKLRRKDLLKLIVQLAAYVQEASGGDEEKILSSGFSVAAPPTPHSDTAGEVHNVRVTDGSNNGRIKVSWSKAENAVMYVILVSQDPYNSNPSDAVGFTTRTTKEVGDFPEGSRQWVKVLALGREAMGPVSEPADIFVR